MCIQFFAKLPNSFLLVITASRKRKRIKTASLVVDWPIFQSSASPQRPSCMDATGEDAQEISIFACEIHESVIGQDAFVEEYKKTMLGRFRCRNITIQSS